MTNEKSHIGEKPLPLDLTEFLQNMKKSLGGIFSPGREILIARAPGRLEVLGGMAETSGALILQHPLPYGFIVAMQKRLDDRMIIRNLNFNAEKIITDEYRLDQLLHNDKLRPLNKLRRELALLGEKKWLAHIIGSMAVVLFANVMTPPKFGINIAIQNSLPIGVGTASSSALQCATLLLLQKIYNFKMNAFQIADICDLLEWKFFDRLGSRAAVLATAFAQENNLIVCSSQPHEIKHREVGSSGIRFVGFDTGIPGPWRSEKYLECQLALVMCSRLLMNTLKKAHIDPPDGGYLANITPDEWATRLGDLVPYRISGKDYLAGIRGSAPYNSWIVSEKRYPTRNLGEYAVMENDRSLQFLSLLDSYQASRDKEKLVKAGELLFASQKDMERVCGSLCAETACVIEMVHAMGPERGLYGARCSSDGQEGIVSILTDIGVEDHIRNLAAQYQTRTGLAPRIYPGSSSGALTTGVISTQFN